MWNKYVMEIKKDGYIKYISHLDMVKLFKNAFKRAEIKLAFSQGFNPHPKMGFAQPLSLGYSSVCEILEFETKDNVDPKQIVAKMSEMMPKGLEILSCKRTQSSKSFAARTVAATYEITIPVDVGGIGEVGSGGADNVDMNRLANLNIDELCSNYLKQNQIIVLKKQKKTGLQKEIDIKSMIQSLLGKLVTISNADDGATSYAIVLNAKLDSGSNSNLSPELLISSFNKFGGIETAREEIEVKRLELFFN